MRTRVSIDGRMTVMLKGTKFYGDHLPPKQRRAVRKAMYGTPTPEKNMARFYGTLQGARGPASRLGNGSSGLTVTAQSYTGDIVVELSAGEERYVRGVRPRKGAEPETIDCVYIGVRDHSSRQTLCLYSGKISDLLSSEWRDALVRTFAEKALLERAGHDPDELEQLKEGR
jgi:hypothetical protein